MACLMHLTPFIIFRAPSIIVGACILLGCCPCNVRGDQLVSLIDIIIIIACIPVCRIIYATGRIHTLPMYEMRWGDIECIDYRAIVQYSISACLPDVMAAILVIVQA